MEKKNYDLNFLDAIKACLNKDGFIRGEDFAKGMYVKADEDRVLIMVNGNNYHRKHMTLYISTGLMGQKWKLFSVANKTQLND